MGSNKKNNFPFPRGSEWRKWDLHVHAPSKYTCAKNDQFMGRDLKEKINNFIKELSKVKDVSVIGITDYFSLEGYENVIKYKNKLKNIDLIIPNIELRITPVTGRNRKINLHIIPNLEVLEIKEVKEFLYEFKFGGKEKYTCRREDLIKLGKKRKVYLSEQEAFKAFKEGLNQFCISYDKFFEIYNNQSDRFRENILIGVSNSSNDGASGIKDIPEIRDIIYEGVDFIFSANPKDIKYFLGKGEDKGKEVIKKYDSLKPCLHGSDYHGSRSGQKICEPDKQRYCWIKSVSSFEGLKQVIYEPEERVKIQVLEPYSVSEAYRMCKIEYESNGKRNILNFNPYLNAIIGTRGSGKSTLLKNIVDKVDNSQLEGELYHLNDFQVVWCNKNRNNDNNKTIRYIGQGYLGHRVYPGNGQYNELKDYIKNLFKNNSRFKSLLESWENANQNIDRIINDNLSNIFKYQNRLYDIEDNLLKLGKEKDIEKEISEIKIKIEIIRKSFKVDKDELKRFHELQEKKSNLCNKIRVAKQDIDSLNFLMKSSVVDSNKLEEVSLSQAIRVKIQKVVSQSVQEVQEFLVGAIKDLSNSIDKWEKQFGEIQSEVKEIENKLKKTEQIIELSRILNDKKEILRKIEYFTQERELYRKNIEDSKDKIFKAFKKRKELANELVNKLSGLFNDKFEFIKISFSIHIQYKESWVYIKSKTNTHNKSPFKETAKDDYPKAYDALFDDRFNVEDLHEIVEGIFEGVISNNLPLISGVEKADYLRRLFANWYDIDYVNAIFNKESGNKFWDMSDGEKVNSLLELLFVLDNNLFPILIDQPEDELDVAAIASTVVKFFKNKKKTRQIIIVSHNANLVVGADAENIIVAKKHKTGRNFWFGYENGAIENLNIKEKVIKILEGGKDAFEKRGEKIGLIKKK